MVPVTINERWTLTLPEHRAGRLEWPTWERERLAAMAELIGGSDVVYDIGAEEGDFPALWASWGARVFMAEPNPRVWPNIRAIFDANDLRHRVEGWWVGFVGDQPREALGKWDARQIGDPEAAWPRCAYGPVIGDHGFLVMPQHPHVPVTTIDLITEDDSLAPPTVITIDVEGAELSVLRGARHTLRRHKPAVYVSVHVDLPWVDENYPGDTGQAVAEYMEGLGYVGRHLATDHEEHWEWRHPEGR